MRKSPPAVTSLLANVWRLQCQGVTLDLRLLVARLTDDVRRTHLTLHQWLNEQCLSTGVRQTFIEKATSTLEAVDLVQEWDSFAS